MKSYVIHPIPLSLAAIDMSRYTYRVGEGVPTVSCSYTWYIEGASRNILVDTGATAEVYAAHGWDIRRKTVQSLEEGLAKLELKPENIDLVIATQLHYDHMGFAHKFTKAKFLVQKAELEAAQDPPPFDITAYDTELLTGLDFEIVDGDYQVEEGIKVLLTPGHTRGGQSVAVSTTKGTAIIVGLCTINENFDPPAKMGKKPTLAAPYSHYNFEESYGSLLRIKKLADIIIPIHEVSFAFVDRIPQI